MSNEAPVLDGRDAQTLLQQLKALASTEVSEWKPDPNDDDAGTMIHRIFARLLGLALERLNRVPEKNLLAFLETMGVSLLPPSPARVPLTFSLTPGLLAVLVPAGSQAGTKPGGQSPSVVFETEDDLTVVPAQLRAEFTVDPTWDLYTDYSLTLGGEAPVPYTPFVGTEALLHVLHLGDDSLLDFGAATVEIGFHWSTGKPGLLKGFLQGLSYQYDLGGTVRSASPSAVNFGGLSGKKGSIVLSLKGPVDLETPTNPVGIPQPTASRWLRIALATPFPDAHPAEDLVLSNITLKISATPHTQLSVVSASGNDITVSPFQTGDVGFSAGSAITVLGKPSLWTTLSQAIAPGKTETRIHVNAAAFVQGLQPGDVLDLVQGLLPESAFENSAPLDVTKEFAPFGTSPAIGDAFYIACKEAFSKPRPTVRVNVAVKEAPAPTLVWEYWNGQTWLPLPSGSVQDGTNGLTQSGTITLTKPQQFSLFFWEAFATLAAAAPTAYAKATGWVNATRNVAMASMAQAPTGAAAYRARIGSGSYSTVHIPLVSSFRLQNLSQTTLTGQISNQTLNLKDALQAPVGSVLQIGSGTNAEFVEVVWVVSDTSLIVVPAPQKHGSGEPVKLLATSPTDASLASQATKNATSLSVTVNALPPADSIVTSPGGHQVWLVDDPNNPPEFVFTDPISGYGWLGGTTITLNIYGSLQNVHDVGTKLHHLSNPVLFGSAGDQPIADFTTATPAVTTTFVSSSGTTLTVSPFQADAGFPVGSIVAVPAKGLQSTLGQAIPPGSTGLTQVVVDDAAFIQALAPNDVLQITLCVYPLGQNPGLTDALILATNPDMGSVSVQVQLVPNPSGVRLDWEFYGPKGWEALETTSEVGAASTFLGSGPVTLSLPYGETYAVTQVNGQENYWIRVRFADGNYGLPIAYVPVDPNDASKGFTAQKGTGNLSPPIIERLTVDYVAERAPSTILTENGFLYADQTSANAATGFRPFVSVKELEPPYYADPEPSLYLGFDSVSEEQPVTLYFDVGPRAIEGGDAKDSGRIATRSSTLPQLKWEYFSGVTWKTLTVFDGTANMAESGTVKFLTPTDMALLAKFDSTGLYYVRVRSSANDPFDTQKLSAVFLNTVLASQSTSVDGEILGSASGQPAQSMAFARPSVLPDQQVLVREPETPTDDELAAIRATEGSDAVKTIVNATTGQQEVWVRWHEMPNFLASDRTSRHYVLDHSSGILSFGDGVNGLIPPRGTNNVTASYKSGGGSTGDVQGGVVAQVKSTLPGVAAVVNLISSDGGADEESLTMVERRGPQTIRHRNHAVASSDIEWLVRQGVGTAVARTKCLPNINRDLAFEPGWVTVIVVPQGGGGKLSPSSDLLSELEGYIQARAFMGLAQQGDPRINLVGPGYIRVTAKVGLVPTNVGSAATVRADAFAAVTAFLHPLTGGANGTGWDFGRDVYASEVFKALQDVQGIDHVESLALVPNVSQYSLGLVPGQSAGVSLPAGSAVMTPDMTKTMLLAEPVQTGVPLLRIRAKGFKEGDRISVAIDLRGLKVDLQNRNTLISDKIFTAQTSFPRGSPVISLDGNPLSRLAEGISAGSQQSQIVLEDALQDTSVDAVTVLSPFPMTVSSVAMNELLLTVQSTPSGNVVTVSPFLSVDDVPAGTPVALSGEPNLRSTLKEAIPASAAARLTQIVVSDDKFAKTLSAGDVLVIDLPSQTLGVELYETRVDIPARTIVARLDNRVRALILTPFVSGQEFSSLEVQGFMTGDQVLVSRRDAMGEVDGLVLSEAAPIDDTVYVDDNFLVYSGNHQVLMAEESEGASS